MPFVLNEHHRKWLSMRTYLNKFACDVAWPINTPERQAIEDMLIAGIIDRIDRCYLPQVNRVCDVYQITPKGLELVKREKIVAVSP